VNYGDTQKLRFDEWMVQQQDQLAELGYFATSAREMMCSYCSEKQSAQPFTCEVFLCAIQMSGHALKGC